MRSLSKVLLFLGSLVSINAQVFLYPESVLLKNQWLSDSQSIEQAKTLKIPINLEKVDRFDFEGLLQYMNGVLLEKNVDLKIGLVTSGPSSIWWKETSSIPIYKQLGLEKSEYLKQMEGKTSYELLRSIRDAYNLAGPFFLKQKILLSPDIAGKDQPW